MDRLEHVVGSVAPVAGPDAPNALDAEALVAALWGSASVAVAVWDADGRYVAVNDHLAVATGRPAGERVGRRPAQVLGDGVADVVQRLVDEVLATGRTRLAVELSEGDRVWETTWLPLHRDGRVVQVVCLAFPVGPSRRRLLENERALRASAEAAGARAGQLLELARRLAAVRRPVDVGVAFADAGFAGTGAVGCGIGMLDEPARQLRVLTTVGGPSWGSIPLDSGLPFARAAVTGRVQRNTRAEVAAVEARAAAWMDRAGARLALSVPLLDDVRTVGSLSLQLPDDDLDDAALEHLQAVAAMIGQALGRAEAQEQAQGAVEELQRALLPQRLPQSSLVSILTGYRASSRAAEIGGDFYDAVALPGDGVLLLLGDVQGHDLAASAIMAQLRAVLHSTAAEGQPPAELLTRADRFLASIEPDRLATAVAVEIMPRTGLAAICMAGHLPPLLVTPEGSRVLDLEPGLPLGLLDRHRVEHVVPLPQGSRLVLFTDGLIERRDESVTTSLERLNDTVTAWAAADAAALADVLLRAAPSQTGDDAAVLVADVVLPASGPSVLTRILPPLPQSVLTARRWATVGLRRLGIAPAALPDVELVLTELVANGTRAAGTPVTVLVKPMDGCVQLGVRDDSQRRPHRREASVEDPDGRGLAIVEMLAERWWVEDHLDGGKTVWAQVAVPSVGRAGAPTP